MGLHHTAETVMIDTDERGFELLITTSDGDGFVFNIQGVAEDLLRQAQDAIGPWVVEKWEAKARIDRLERDAHPLLTLHHTPEIWEG